MSILKAGDKVRINHNAYNIADHRFGRTATVSRIDAASQLLPVRIEYDSFQFNWTNYESLTLVEAAPSENATIGAEILERMQTLKASIVTRDNAVKLVVEQTEALDALLASVGLKRGEQVPPIPVRVTATSRTALDDVADKTIREGMKYRCTTEDMSYFSKDEIYKVVELDSGDNNQPVAFKDNDDDEYYPERYELAYFIRVI
jgi:hypothetical protein